VEEEQEGLGKRENCIANHVILPTVEWWAGLRKKNDHSGDLVDKGDYEM
jgi:hypothetical protein